MSFKTNSFAKCWQIQPGKGNFTNVRLSTSRKNRDTGAYEQDFSGYVMFIGNAHAKAQKLKEGDRIRLGEVDVTTNYDKQRQKEYVNYRCFSFEMADEAGNAASAAAQPTSGGVPDEETLPF